uniref:Uncharacterized protein n=1 Tax=Ditylenchus dipsaci TaxID=166011 RepID=A0A915DY54_9BILA
MRTPRPYIKSSLNLDLHMTENVGTEAEKVLMDLLQLLSSNGFQRANTKQERRKKILNCDISKPSVLKDEDASASEELCAKKSERKQKRCDFGVIGLRSVLKLLNRSSDESNSSKQNPLSAILFDSGILKPTAVAHLIALAALGRTELCPFYVIPNLSEMMSKQLNISRVSVIGLLAKAVEELPSLKTAFHQIGLSPKRPNTDASSSSFVTPTIRVPKGKSEDKKKMNSKKKKKEKKRLAKKK